MVTVSIMAVKKITISEGDGVSEMLKVMDILRYEQFVQIQFLKT